MGASSIGDTFKTLQNTGYYGWGYAVLCSWTYRLFGSLEAVYHVYLIMNAFFVSLVPTLAHEIMVKFFGLAKKEAFLIALCVGFYPAYVIYSKYAMNESMLLFIVWPILYLLLDFQHVLFWKKLLYSFLLGFLAAYAYTVHGRGLAILGVVALCFLLQLLVNKGSAMQKLACCLLFGAIILLVNKGNSIVRNYIASGFVGEDVDSLTNTTEQFVNASFFKMLIGPNSYRILYGFSGQAYYIATATLGLAPLAGVVYMHHIWTSWKSRNCDNWVIAGTYVVGLMIAALLISVLFFASMFISEAMQQAEYYMYGRYLEMTGGLLVFFALLAVCRADGEQRGFHRRTYVLAIAIYTVITALAIVVAFRKILQTENPKLSYTMVAGIVPFSGSTLYNDPTASSYIRLFIVALLISFAIFLLLMFRCKKTLYAACICIFVYSAAFSLSQFVYPSSIRNKGKVESLISLNGSFQQPEQQGCLNAVYVLDSTIPKPKVLFAFSKFPVFYMENVQCSYLEYGKTEENSLFISTKDEHLDYIFADIYKVDGVSGYYIWGRGDELREQLEQLGYPCEKRSGGILILDGADLTLRSDLMSAEEKENLINLQNKSNSIYIQPGDGNFGPYTGLCAGRYQVDIYGHDLTSSNYWAYYNLGTVSLELEVQVFTDDHIRYCIAMPEFFNDVEFCSINLSDSPVIIDKLIITPLETWCQTSLSDAGNTYFRHRYYDVSDGYCNFRSYLEMDANYVSGRTYIRLFNDGELTVRDMPLAPGQNRLTLQGANIQFADVSVVSSDGSVLPVALGQGTDSCTFDVENADAVTITIQNHSGAAIDFSGLDIRWMGSYE